MAGGVRGFGGVYKGLFGGVTIEQIAFQISDFGFGDEIFVDVAGGQFDAGAQESVHGALGVWRYANKAAAGFCTHNQGLGIKLNP